MLPTRTLWTPPTSGFVPFSPAAESDDADVLEAPVVARTRAVDDAQPRVAAATDAAARIALPARQTQTWQPSTTLAVRRVEMAVLAAVCGYFTFGLAKLVGLL